MSSESYTPMPDGIARRAVKAVARWLFFVEVWLKRRWLRLRHEDRYTLSGACESCAKCCEAPALAVHPLLYHIPPLRMLVLLWQWEVNRFLYVSRDDESATLTFRCGHFDPRTRKCDSYGSRPGICRDYPRFLLDQPWPELFDACGYRAVSRNASGLATALDSADLSDEQRAELKKKLHILQ